MPQTTKTTNATVFGQEEPKAYVRGSAHEYPGNMDHSAAVLITLQVLLIQSI